MIFVIPTAVAVAWLVGVRGTPAALIAKPIASAGFVSVALASGALDSGYGRVVLVGLVLGAAGDALLMFERWFLLGLVSFAAGHVAFIVAFLDVAAPTAVSSAISAAVAIGSGAWLLPHLDRPWRAPVSMYIVVISVMLAAALPAGQRSLVTAGAALFAASDLLVARERFVDPDPRNALWGLPLYYTGQVLIALSVVG